MSRTVRSKSQRIHLTRGVFTDGDAGELRRVRALRARVQRVSLAARHSAPTPSSIADGVLIRVDEPARHVWYPATIDDMREVLRVLPADATEGLRAVEVSARAWRSDSPTYAPIDPVTGRHGYEEIIPGVHGRRDDWGYHPRTATACVYGYVTSAPRDGASCVDIALRHRMLAGLVKAVAFHHERRLRAARGHRVPHDVARDDARSRALADRWIRDLLGPWIARTLPAEVARFEAWTRAHGGVALPLDVIETFDDARMPGGVIMGVFEALGRLMRALERGDDAGEAAHDFAFWLHYDGHFELALAALERRLAVAPDDARAVELRAHVLEHLA